jgi:transcriptional regulator GlxA family with amidase domain
VASGIDLALHILEKEAGHYLTHKVARELVVYIRRGGNEAQHSVFLSYRNHLHTGVHQVQDWLNENLHKKYSIDDLAEMAHMSTRNFTRIFKKETGITVSDYITLLRCEKIRELKKKPDLSRHQIAQHIGLQSDRQLRRVMASMEG